MVPACRVDPEHDPLYARSVPTSWGLYGFPFVTALISLERKHTVVGLASKKVLSQRADTRPQMSCRWPQIVRRLSWTANPTFI